MPFEDNATEAVMGYPNPPVAATIRGAVNVDPESVVAVWRSPSWATVVTRWLTWMSASRVLA
ncbi:hypothetical protein RHCRD62_30683 [Rhodococcus sp. RD6.2]|nr:hypothetical protein RHCRD62_30683 [Rhodococcus sp. RD6.2]